jgi:hypothetical protein
VVRRVVLLVLVALSVGGGAVFWVQTVEPARRHHAFCRALDAELKTLAHKRPPGVTRNQWHHVVAWTWNAHSNTLVASPGIPRVEQERLLAELRERLASPVTLATIDWIWDEFVRLSPGWGASYSDRWRPTGPEKLREFEETGATWAGVNVD